MITKERLEELIEQCATIWYWEYGKLRERELNKSYHTNIFMDKEWLCKSYCDFDDDVKITHIAPFFKVFETKEDAEWYKEFGCIERTERLELPTWEEFLELNRHCIEFHFITKEGEINYLVISDMYMHNDMLKPKDEWTIVIHNEDDEYIFEKPLTKENYTLACRKAKEIFLGLGEKK